MTVGYVVNVKLASIQVTTGFFKRPKLPLSQRGLVSIFWWLLVPFCTKQGSNELGRHILTTILGFSFSKANIAVTYFEAENKPKTQTCG